MRAVLGLLLLGGVLTSFWLMTPTLNRMLSTGTLKSLKKPTSGSHSVHEHV